MAPPRPPVTAEEEDDGDEVVERPWPPHMRMNLGPYALYCVFSGAGARGQVLGCAYAGLHCALYIVRFISLSIPAAAFWAPATRVLQCLCYAATALVMCVFIRHYMDVDGVYVVEFDPPPHELAAAPAGTATMTVVEQLPPPPPEMDMC